MRFPAHAGLQPQGLAWEPPDAATLAWLAPLKGLADTLECAYSGVRGGRPAYARLRRTGDAGPRAFVKLIPAALAAREKMAAELGASLAAQGVLTPVLHELLALADGSMAFCYDWIAGRPPGGSTVEAAALGRALAGLHGALRRGGETFDIARRTRDRLAAFAELAASPRFASRWRDHGEQVFVSRMRDAFLAASDAMLRDAVPNHGDLNGGNVLLRGDGEVAFLDLEDALHTAVWPGFDLAKAIERMVLPAASSASLAEQAIAALVQAYARSDGRAFDALACPGSGRLAAAMRWHMGLAVLVLSTTERLPPALVERELAKFKAVDVRIDTFRLLL